MSSGGRRAVTTIAAGAKDGGGGQGRGGGWVEFRVVIEWVGGRRRGVAQIKNEITAIRQRPQELRRQTDNVSGRGRNARFQRRVVSLRSAVPGRGYPACTVALRYAFPQPPRCFSQHFLQERVEQVFLAVVRHELVRHRPPARVNVLDDEQRHGRAFECCLL
jgi:hypothetical protein